MSDPASAGSVSSTTRSAPSASAFCSGRWAFSRPMQTATISSTSWPASRSLIASSRPCTSNGFSSLSPDRSSRCVDGSSRFALVALGTSFTQTAMFNPLPLLRVLLSYLPMNVGVRFSTNARSPSRASSVENISE